MKTDLDSQLTARVQSFARELQDLVREQALEAVRTVLGGNGKAMAPRTQAAAPAARPAKKAGRRSTKKTGGSTPALRRGKRTNALPQIRS